MGQMIVLPLSIVLLAIFGSKLTTALIETAKHRQKTMQLMEAGTHYLKVHNISIELSVQLKQYIRSQKKSKHPNKTDDEWLLNNVLPSMRRLLLQEARCPYIVNNVFFDGLKFFM